MLRNAARGRRGVLRQRARPEDDALLPGEGDQRGRHRSGVRTSRMPPPPEDVPGAPTGLTATAVDAMPNDTTTQIDLAWSAPDEIEIRPPDVPTGYRIEVSDDGGATFTDPRPETPASGRARLAPEVTPQDEIVTAYCAHRARLGDDAPLPGLGDQRRRHRPRPRTSPMPPPTTSSAPVPQIGERARWRAPRSPIVVQRGARRDGGERCRRRRASR